MNIFLFILGLILGFGIKLGADYYYEWKTEQKKTYMDMTDILINFRAIEKLKELDKKNVSN